MDKDSRSSSLAKLLRPALFMEDEYIFVISKKKKKK